ncbi:hypothetical protein HHI36_001944 [Cryptolaemus montrouzieri]|uniref:Uncharacterized protein n=1 Tax=Cryptolaemus montrouzieri TaxID=559131 RepID=A0ABD2P954_9CUCU
MNFFNNCTQKTLISPPWIISTTQIIETLTPYPKSETNPSIVHNIFSYLNSQFHNYNAIYEDASKTGTTANDLANDNRLVKLPEYCSIDTGDFFKEGLNLAESEPKDTFVIITNPLSAIEFFKQLHSKNPIKRQIRQKLYQLSLNDEEISI